MPATRPSGPITGKQLMCFSRIKLTAAEIAYSGVVAIESGLMISATDQFIGQVR